MILKSGNVVFDSVPKYDMTVIGHVAWPADLAAIVFGDGGMDGEVWTQFDGGRTLGGELIGPPSMPTAGSAIGQLIRRHRRKNDLGPRL